MKLSEYAELDATELAALVRGGAVSPRELVETALTAIQRTDKEIHAVVDYTYDYAMEQIKKVVTYKGSKTVEKYRDFWFFSYLCNGINFKDMLFLRYGNIVDGEICFVRSKTSHTSNHIREIRAVLTPEMRDIIKRWGNPDDGKPDTFLFKYARETEDEFVISNIVRRVTHRCNIALAKIAQAVGVPRFTTYSARHSYATVLKRSGTNIAYISESLGHSSLAITENYLASFEQEERIRNAQLLTKFD